jgi:hypothetical protein
MRLLILRALLLTATMRAVEALDESLFLLDVEVSSGLTKTRSLCVFAYCQAPKWSFAPTSSPPGVCSRLSVALSALSFA